MKSTKLYALFQNTTLLTGNAWAYKMYDASAFLPPSGLLEVKINSLHLL